VTRMCGAYSPHTVGIYLSSVEATHTPVPHPTGTRVNCCDGMLMALRVAMASDADKPYHISQEEGAKPEREIMKCALLLSYFFLLCENKKL
jgi:hypothetical protein